MSDLAPIKIGVLTASASRRAGGLFEALPPLLTGLQRESCDAMLFSTVDDAVFDDAGRWGNTALSLWQLRGPQSFGYAPGLAKALDQAGVDLVHTHGLWMYPSVAAVAWAARWKRPYVVSPHGMLEPWALRNAASKKRVAGLLFEGRHLRQAACLHALNDAEYNAIRAKGLSNPVAVIPNGVELPSPDRDLTPPEWAADLTNERVLLFLGRLHPKKGLSTLLRAWSAARANLSADVEGWRLVIAGWDEGDHEAELRCLAETLQLCGSVRFVGPQFGADKDASLARADAFVLPSLSEGLPMAVLEAWSYGLPVLMTEQCNVPEGRAHGAAWDIALDLKTMTNNIAAFLALSPRVRQTMGERGRLLVERQFNWSKSAAEMAEVYRWLIKGGERPTSVRVK